MKQMDPRDQADLDNHANQLNPNNEAYWKSRGLDDRPDDWEEDSRNDDDDYRSVSNNDEFETTCWSWDD